MIKSLNLYSRPLLPKRIVMLVPLLLTIPVGFWIPQTLGGGQGLIEGIHNHQYPLMILSLLLITHFGLTMFSYGTGAPGGIFMPMLVMGALAGGVFSGVAEMIWHIDTSFSNNFVVFAMAAYFTAIVKAPITGSILITEMTGSFEHLPALITVSMTAYIVADLLKSQAIYDRLLESVLARQRSEASHNTSSQNTLLEVAVSVGSFLETKMIKDITWPPNCLLVNIKRGENHIIPKGETRIIAGDYLNILTSERQAKKVKRVLLQMSGHIQGEV